MRIDHFTVATIPLEAQYLHIAFF